MIKGSEYCSKVIETEFNKPLVMTEKDHEGFNNSKNQLTRMMSKLCPVSLLNWSFRPTF